MVHPLTFPPDESRGRGTSVTLLVPHYRTPETLELCLAALARHTRHPHVVRVLDQGTPPEALAPVIARYDVVVQHAAGPNDPMRSHAESLNRAVERLTTPYFLIMHSDTMVVRSDWLGWLVSQAELGGLAAVGSRGQGLRRRRGWDLLYRRLRDCVREAALWRAPRLRSCCSLYRTAAVRKAGARFALVGSDVTHPVTQRLAELGYAQRAIPATRMARWVQHASGTTRIATGVYGGREQEPFRESDPSLA